MTSCFFDSSAFAKLFLPEAGSAEVQRLYGECDFRMVSALLWVEVRSAIRRRQRMGDVSTSDVDRMMLLLVAQRDFVATADLNEAVLSRAADLIDRQQLRSLDAVQLATALEASAGVSELVFISADIELLAAAKAEGLAVLNQRVYCHDPIRT